VFNCLDLMDNGKFLEELKFAKGDGFLHYYLFNYRCRDVEPSKMGLVLL
jgi:glycylpeptide N-tetradecanoyltransferase